MPPRSVILGWFLENLYRPALDRHLLLCYNVLQGRDSYLSRPGRFFPKNSMNWQLPRVPCSHSPMSSLSFTPTPPYVLINPCPLSRTGGLPRLYVGREVIGTPR